MAEWWGWYEWSVPFRRPDDRGVPGPYPHGRQWRPTVARSPADSDAHLEWTAAAARWLAARNDIRICTLGKALSEHTEPSGQWLTRAQIRSVARQIVKKFDHLQIADTTLSAADALFVLAQYAEFLLRDEEHPAHLQIRRTIGPVEPVLVPKTSVIFKRADLLLGARQLVNYVNAHGRLPHAIRSHGVDCGPAELLLGLAKAIAVNAFPDTVTVAPTVGVPDCSAIDCFARATAGSSHAPPGYTPDRIHMQGLQQSWSYRPAVRR